MRQLLLPYVYAIQAHEFSDVVSQKDPAELQYRTSWHEVQQGHYRTAEDSCLKALESWKRNLGQGDLKTLQAAGLLGTIVKYQGDYGQATTLQREILAQRS
jgi:hypothetical protein